MNVGQVLETHLGWAAGALGFRAITPVFDGAQDDGDRRLSRPRLARGARRTHFAPASMATPHPDGENLDVPVMEAWLKEQGYDFRKVFDESQVGEAKRACLEIWLEQHR